MVRWRYIATSSGRFPNPELFHPGMERRWFDVQHLGRARRAAYLPLRSLKRLQNVFSFMLLEGRELGALRGGDRLGKPFAQFELSLLTDDHRALNHIFQFPYVARPGYCQLER